MSNSTQEPKVFNQVIERNEEGTELLVPQRQFPEVEINNQFFLSTVPQLRVGAEGAISTPARGNQVNEVLASAARTSSTNSGVESNFNNRGAHFVIDVTALTGSPEIIVTIQGRVQQTGLWYDILEGNIINSIGTTVLKVYPGIVGSSNASANDILPYQYRVSVDHANGDSITYSIHANLVV